MPALRPSLYEVTVAYGLEQVAAQEVRRLDRQLRFVQNVEDEEGSGALQFRYRGHAQRILQLNTILNAFLVCHFDAPRPQSLLDRRHFSTLLAHINFARRLFPPGSYRNFGISAAGADSPVMQRLQQRLSQALKLPFAPDEVDLLLRIRPSRLQEGGWEVLIRLSPRPLSVRAWRAADMKGALNAAVAHCMVRLTRPRAGDKFLNLCCGSGTLLLERLIAAPAQRVIGCDIDSVALEHARANLAAGGATHAVELYDWDARTLNLPDAGIDAICADLPFGIAVGSHNENLALYPGLLAEAARVAKPQARFVLITQEMSLIEQLLHESTHWQQVETFKIDLRGLKPRIFVLQRTSYCFG